MNDISNLLAKFIAAMSLLGCALGVTYLQMVHAWGLELKSFGWFIGTSLLSGVIISAITSLGKNQ